MLFILHLYELFEIISFKIILHYSCMHAVSMIFFKKMKVTYLIKMCKVPNSKKLAIQLLDSFYMRKYILFNSLRKDLIVCILYISMHSKSYFS